MSINMGNTEIFYRDNVTPFLRYKNIGHIHRLKAVWLCNRLWCELSGLTEYQIKRIENHSLSRETSMSINAMISEQMSSIKFMGTSCPMLSYHFVLACGIFVAIFLLWSIGINGSWIPCIRRTGNSNCCSLLYLEPDLKVASWCWPDAPEL